MAPRVSRGAFVISELEIVDMTAHIAIDEYGVIHPRNEWNCVIRLPDDLSALVGLAVDKMESLNRDIYVPDARVWHWGHRDGRPCRINYSGAVMAAVLGVRPHQIVNPDDLGEEDETFYNARLHAIDSVYRLCDIEMGMLLAAGYDEILRDDFDAGGLYAGLRKLFTPERAAVVAKWREYAEYVDADALFKGWDEVETSSVVMREIAHDLRRVGW